MSAIARDHMTGEMQRQRAIHGTAKDRDRWHAQHELEMERIADDVETYLDAFVKWIALLNKQAVLAIVGWYAHEHGLSFYEAVASLFWHGDAYWIRVCKQFGEAHA